MSSSRIHIQVVVCRDMDAMKADCAGSDSYYTPDCGLRIEISDESISELHFWCGGLRA